MLGDVGSSPPSRGMMDDGFTRLSKSTNQLLGWWGIIDRGFILDLLRLDVGSSRLTRSASEVMGWWGCCWIIYAL